MNSPAYGRDGFIFSVSGGPTPLDTSFSNNPKSNTEGSYQAFYNARLDKFCLVVLGQKQWSALDCDADGPFGSWIVGTLKGKLGEYSSDCALLHSAYCARFYRSIVDMVDFK